MSEWRPIESAPKDALRIVWIGNARHSVMRLCYFRKFKEPLDGKDGYWVDYQRECDVANFFQPTHWQDTPAPPQESSRG